MQPPVLAVEKTQWIIAIGSLRLRACRARARARAQGLGRAAPRSASTARNVGVRILKVHRCDPAEHRLDPLAPGTRRAFASAVEPAIGLSFDGTWPQAESSAIWTHFLVDGPFPTHGTVGSCDTSPGAASNHCTRTEVTMISAVLMVRRLVAALRVALREEDFERVLTAGLLLIVIGTLAYSIGGGWSIVDGLYVAVATLTTSSILDPALTITDPWLKVFTAGYVLVGIGHPGRTRSAARNGLHDGTAAATSDTSVHARPDDAT
jgi:hypothetical protein